MGVVLLGVHVVEVVGDDQRQPRLRGEAQQLLVEAALLRDLVVLQLQVEPVLAQDVRVLAGELAGELPVVHLERLGDLAAEARGHPDETLAVLREVLAVDARLVVVAVDVGVRDEAAQVLVAGHVRGQQDQVEGLAVRLALLVAHGPPGDVRLDADDRLDARLRGRLVERDRAVEGAVIRDGEAVEAVPDRRVHEVGDAPQPVEQAELRVGVEMDEVVGGDGHQGVNRTRRDSPATLARFADGGRPMVADPGGASPPRRSSTKDARHLVPLRPLPAASLARRHGHACHRRVTGAHARTADEVAPADLELRRIRRGDPRRVADLDDRRDAVQVRAPARTATLAPEGVRWGQPSDRPPRRAVGGATWSSGRASPVWA